MIKIIYPDFLIPIPKAAMKTIFSEKKYFFNS